MELKPLKKITVSDYNLQKIQGYSRDFSDQLLPNPFIVGVILDISLTTTATAFNHGLQQTPSGWIILDKDSNADVWRTDWDERTITLDASASTTIKLWVF